MGVKYRNELSVTDRSPVVVYTLYMLIGCLLGSVIILKLSYILLSVLTVVLTALFLYLFLFEKLKKCIKYLFFIAFILIGYFGFRLESTKPDSVEILKKNTKYELSFILKEPINKKENFIHIRSKINNSSKNIFLKINIDTSSEKYCIGDTLVCIISNEEINKDYQKNYYLNLKSHQIKLKKCINSDLILKMLKFRITLSKIADEKFISSNNGIIFKALILGDKKNIPEEIKSYFTSSGLMHMLAISGMHIGYIYSLLLIVFSFLGKGKISLILRSFLILVFIWQYTILTGFGDSVVRAAVMITIHQFAYILERGKISLNTIGISALIMVTLNPLSLFNLGFQLSFMATLSIILLFPLFNNIYNPGNKIIKRIWQVIAMSISSQTGTLLLTIFSFGKFPVYFLLANVLAAPVIIVTMILSFAAFLSLPINFLTDQIFKCAEFSISVLIFIAKSISNLPFSTLEF